MVSDCCSGALRLATGLPHLVRAGRNVQAAHYTRDPLSPLFHVNLVRAVRFFQLAFIVACAPAAPRAVPESASALNRTCAATS